MSSGHDSASLMCLPRLQGDHTSHHPRVRYIQHSFSLLLDLEPLCELARYYSAATASPHLHAPGGKFVRTGQHGHEVPGAGRVAPGDYANLPQLPQYTATGADHTEAACPPCFLQQPTAVSRTWQRIPDREDPRANRGRKVCGGRCATISQQR